MGIPLHKRFRKCHSLNRLNGQEKVCRFVGIAWFAAPKLTQSFSSHSANDAATLCARDHEFPRIPQPVDDQRNSGADHHANGAANCAGHECDQRCGDGQNEGGLLSATPRIHPTQWQRCYWLGNFLILCFGMVQSVAEAICTITPFIAHKIVRVRIFGTEITVSSHICWFVYVYLLGVRCM